MQEFKVPSSNNLLLIFDLIKSEFDKITTINSFESSVVEVTEDNTSSVTIPFDLEEGMDLMIYHNGLLLTKDIHYTYNSYRLILKEYTANAGDIINFIKVVSLASIDDSLDSILNSQESYLN